MDPGSNVTGHLIELGSTGGGFGCENTEISGFYRTQGTLDGAVDIMLSDTESTHITDVGAENAAAGFTIDANDQPLCTVSNFNNVTILNKPTSMLVSGAQLVHVPLLAIQPYTPFTALRTLVNANALPSPTASRVKIDTSSTAVTAEDVNNIAAGEHDGQIVIYSTTTNARDITFKHNAGNIRFMDGADRVLDFNWKKVKLMWDATLALWIED